MTHNDRGREQIRSCQGLGQQEGDLCGDGLALYLGCGIGYMNPYMW